MVRRTVKNKPRRMRSQTKKLGLGSKKPIKKKSLKKKPLKKKPLKKKPSKKTKKGVGILNHFRKKKNPSYKLRTIVFFYNDVEGRIDKGRIDDGRIDAFYVKPKFPLEESHALKIFSFFVTRLDLDINNKIEIKKAVELGEIKEAVELGSEETLKKKKMISFPINKYSTIPLGKDQFSGKELFSLKFWGKDENTHQKIIEFFKPIKKRFRNFLLASNNKPLRHTLQPSLTSGINFSEQNLNYNASSLQSFPSFGSSV